MIKLLTVEEIETKIASLQEDYNLLLEDMGGGMFVKVAESLAHFKSLLPYAKEIERWKKTGQNFYQENQRLTEKNKELSYLVYGV